MKQISIWAYSHVWKARLLVILLHILLVTIAIYWGIQFNVLDGQVIEAALYLLTVIYLLLYLLYYGVKRWKRYYWYRAVMHTTMALVSFLLVFAYTASIRNFESNNSVMASVIEPSKNGQKFKHPEAEQLLQLIKKGEVTKLKKAERKLLRSELKYQLHRFKEARQKGDKENSGNAGLIILTIVLALVAFIGVSSLACEISCNGNDGAAVVVFLLGTAAIVFLMIVVFKSLKKRKQPSGTTKSETPS
jgi:hypothetical protein